MAPARVLGLTVVLAVARTAGASPLELFGFGARSPALAATGVASSDDFESVYTNPAGLADVGGRRLSVGTLFGSFSLSGVDRPVDDAVGIEIGLAARLPLGGALADRLSLAVGLYLPGDLVVRARAPRAGAPTFAVLENRSQAIGVQVGAGVRVSDRLSLGGGVLALAALHGRIHIVADASGQISSTSEEQLLASFAPVLGARYRVGERLAVGATLHLPSESGYDIRVSNALGQVLPITLPELRIAGTAQYDPLILAVEAAVRPRPDLLASAQLSWERWSAFPLPTENVVAGSPPPAPPDFHDTLVPRVAAEWTIGAFAVRAGYAFVPTPAPDGARALLDNSRHVFSLGAGVAAPPLHVDAWAQAHVLAARRFGDVETDGSILVGGMMVGVDL